MSSYQSVVGGRLRLKGKRLHVFKAKAEAADPISKKKRKKHKHRYAPHSQVDFGFCSVLPSKLASKSMQTRLSTDTTDDNHEAEKDGDEATAFEDHLTPAERKFLEQTRQLELQRLAKMATKSHHDRIQKFNQYLANLTEHYDIPKVGPG
ncbi:hypothetical protein J1N35_034555 [Gossypium stocksii]|uniref:Protein FAM32A-like n=1 Tax=Gossypium stocksii TaxID=47602 RepID=A0A9D3US90_9ROSI|nr:hypothetical protein J1N35_034555 [Gossypium stocksii]